MANYRKLKKLKGYDYAPQGEERLQRIKDLKEAMSSERWKALNYVFSKVYDSKTGNINYMNIWSVPQNEREQFNKAVNKLAAGQSDMYKRMVKADKDSPWKSRVEGLFGNIYYQDKRGKQQAVLRNNGDIKQLDIFDQDLFKTGKQAEKYIEALVNVNSMKYQGLTGLRYYIEEFNAHNVSKKGGYRTGYDEPGEQSPSFEVLNEENVSDFWRIYNRIKANHKNWDSDQLIEASLMVINGQASLSKLLDTKSYTSFIEFIGDVLDIDEINKEW